MKAFKTFKIKCSFEYEAGFYPTEDPHLSTPESVIESDLPVLEQKIKELLFKEWGDDLLSISAVSHDASPNSYTSVVGDNALLISEVSKVYLKPGWRIADITYGEGAFWKRVDVSKYKLFASDILTCPEARYDFRKLPYKNSDFHVVIFDPPYTHNPGQLMVNKTYKNKETTHGLYHWDILQLYRAGMKEAVRVLKKNGFLWVKCKDEVESSLQKWSHREIFDIGVTELGLYAKDLFILTQASKPVVQFAQQHGRKNHSYLWIFQKI